MIDDIDSVAREVEATLNEAEDHGVDRHEVADLLERFADEVREGYTDLPENRGQWWRDVHGEHVQEVEG